ncbi:MAG: LacI family DNA-binding transcriptional regulator [Lachnospiraceae bacterium]|nr:LacI family DNA-binding transcriptional regulator [Lachnospiraceae bacterium]
MITVKEIAQMCNVSVSTVSNILNGKPNASEETRRRVWEAIKQTGYQPNYFAQSIRKKKSKVISIVVEDLGEFSTPPIVEAAMEYCEEQGYRCVLINLRLYNKWKASWYDEEDLVKAALKPHIQEILSIKSDGVLYIAGHCRYIDYFPQDFLLPVVLAYGLAVENKYPSVVIDDEKGGYDITKYLLEKGHGKIGVVTGVKDNLHTKERLAGYKRALAEANIAYEPRLICEGDWSRRSGYAHMSDLLEGGVSAVFAMNDSMAAGVYDYLYEQELVPGEDISVIGYDNKELAEYLRPELSTNQVPLKEIGHRAAQILLERLESEEQERNNEPIRLPCKMIHRKSVADLN